jgi:ankyrin repeat protein
MYAVNEIDIGEERKDARGLLVKQLLRKGVNANAQDASGVNALMLAAGKGNTNATKFLLQNGADPNRVDRDGATPLMWAAGGPNLRVFREIAALLLSAGAHANYKRKDGKTVFDLLDESSKLEFRKLMAQRQD